LLDPFLVRMMALLDSGWLSAAPAAVAADATLTTGRNDILKRAAAEWTWRQRWIQLLLAGVISSA